MIVHNGQYNHDVHDLVAVAPVVKQAWAKALWDLNDVDQTSQNCQEVHNHKKTHGVRTAHATAEHSKQEKAEAEKDLPDKGSEAQDVGAGRRGTVDPISRQHYVGQQGGLLHGWVAQEGDVNNRECA